LSDSHEIRHEQSASNGRYAINVDGLEAELTYALVGKHMVIDHTYVPSALRERGLGQALVKRAVEDARAQGLQIEPVCWFARQEIARRKEWQDVLAR
jgi:predicted GNAT family acetyltransferase